MPLRSRPEPHAGSSRLAVVLPGRPVPAPGGWVPEQSPVAVVGGSPAGTEDPFWPEPDGEDGPWSWSAVGGRAAAADDGDGVRADVRADRVDRADRADRAEPVEPLEPVESADAEPPGLPVAPGVSEVLGVLARLRGGRLDPGRSGVLALLLVGGLAAVVAGALLLRGRPSEQPVAAPPVLVAPAAGPTARPEVVVAVAGKVRRPGLVHLPLGSRVDDALRAAGGALPGAEVGALNLARKVVDGELVLVGVPAAAGAPAAAGGPAGVPAGPLDLNAATAGDFDALPGIGPVLAQRIVDWRTEHGRFASVDQLREVSGIGESKFASLRAKVRV